MPSKALKIIRENLTVECAEVMLTYRRHCAASADPKQVSEYYRVNKYKLTVTLVDDAHRAQYFTRPSELYSEV